MCFISEVLPPRCVALWVLYLCPSTSQRQGFLSFSLSHSCWGKAFPPQSTVQVPQRATRSPSGCSSWLWTLGLRSFILSWRGFSFLSSLPLFLRTCFSLFVGACTIFVGPTSFFMGTSGRWSFAVTWTSSPGKHFFAYAPAAVDGPAQACRWDPYWLQTAGSVWWPRSAGLLSCQGAAGIHIALLS